MTKRSAIRNRLASESMTAQDAEAWCDRWEAEGDRQGLERHRTDYWQLGWAWVGEQRQRPQG